MSTLHPTRIRTSRNDNSSRTASKGRPVIPSSTPGEMSHREIMDSLFAILAGTFTVLLSVNIVANALPTIIADLHGTEGQYTWVITVALLVNAASTPVWGKLSDLHNKKPLTELALGIFVAGSMLAGLSGDIPTLMASRAIQGLGMGGMMALSMALIGSIIPPRQRGRYQGYLGGTMAAAQAGGPVLGGYIVDTLGWRWTFFVCVPLAIVSFIMLHLRLHVPTVRREARIDWLGAVVMVSTVSLALVGVTSAGTDFPWVSWQSGLYLAATIIGVALTIIIEWHAAEPVIPIRLIGTRTTGLAVLASVAVGIALFGATTFLAQYFQIARGYSAGTAGILQIFNVMGMLIASTATGSLITRFGAWKRYLVAGAIILTGALSALAFVDHATPMPYVLCMTTLLGIGTGMLMQNLVLCVQNAVALKDVGTASSAVAFFRTFGGAIGISVLGAVLASRATSMIGERLASLGVSGQQSLESGASLDLSSLPASIQDIVRAVYGDGIGFIFLITALVSLVTVACVCFIPNTQLRRTLDIERPRLVEAGAGGNAPSRGTTTVRPVRPEVTALEDQR